MKRTLSMAFLGCLIAGISAYGQGGQNAQDPKTDKSTTPPATDKSTTATAEDAQRIATGQITKIDVKKKILTVREASLNEPADSGSNSNTNRRGGMGGRRRGGTGTGYPYPGGGGGRPTSTSKTTGKEFKVIVTDDTAIKDHVTTIGFDLLRVGDRISIQGLPKGKGDDLQATQITVSQ